MQMGHCSTSNGRTPFAPRCLKDVMEERLFAHRRNLFTRLNLVFMDTTSPGTSRAPAGKRWVSTATAGIIGRT